MEVVAEGVFVFSLTGDTLFVGGLFGGGCFFFFLLTTVDDACHGRPVDGSERMGYSCVVVRRLPIAYLTSVARSVEMWTFFWFARPCLTKGERVSAVLG